MKTFIPNLKRPDGSFTESIFERAETLSDVSEPMGPLPEFGMKGPTVIDDTDINFESVKEEFAKLNCFKSMGTDAIHPKVLTSLFEDISFVDVVVKLFRNCIDTGTIPSMWKMANVIALHKNGS